VSFDGCTTYTYDGASRQAMVLTARRASALATATLTPTSPSNPLGVVVVNGDFEIDRNMRVINGILVVLGDLTLNQRDLIVDGKQGYFSLLVKDDLYFCGPGKLTVNAGPAYLGRPLSTQWGSGMEATFTGGLVAARGITWDYGGTLRGNNVPRSEQGVSLVRYFGSGAGGERTVTTLAYSADGGD